MSKDLFGIVTVQESTRMCYVNMVVQQELVTYIINEYDMGKCVYLERFCVHSYVNHISCEICAFPYECMLSQVHFYVKRGHM